MSGRPSEQELRQIVAKQTESLAVLPAEPTATERLRAAIHDPKRSATR